MDLQELQARSGVPRDVLRYCLDRGLVPGLKYKSFERGPGRPRQFGDGEACMILCAAHLSMTGIPARKVKHFLGLLHSFELIKPDPPKRAWSVVFEERWRATARYADGVYVRLLIPDLNFDSQWTHSEDVQSVPRYYMPTVEVTLDLQAIWLKVAAPRP